MDVSQEGLIDFVPNPSQVGVHEVQISVTDNQGRKAVTTLMINVARTNKAPIVEQFNPQRIEVGRRHQIRIKAYDPDGDVLSYKIIPDGLKERLQIELLRDGTFTWTPLYTGELAMTVLVSDGFEETPVRLYFQAY